MSHPTIQQGSQGDLVKLAQTRLNQRKVVTPPLNVDGDFGPKTLAAVKTYQTDRSIGKPLALSFPLIVDGIVGGDTWFRLDPEVVKRGSHSLTVKLLQELLKAAGAAFDPGPIDSDFGPLTEAAVKKFQQANKDFDGNPLVVDGIVGIRTWAALKS